MNKLKIIVASYNSHKLKEIHQILTSFGISDIELLSPFEILGKKIDIDETGATFKENALIKADCLFSLTGLPTIADDSGLVTDFLGGAPGINSARFSGEHGDDAANRLKMLDAMKECPPEKRTARFKAVICLRYNDITEYFEGIAEGKIALSESGKGGFGYDPLFVPEGFSVTFAEMTAEQKNKLSHRSKALKQFADYLTHSPFLFRSDR